MPSLGMRRLTRQERLLIIIAISCSFFVLEIAIGFRNHSLTLVADAFHVSNDLIGFVIALLAIRKASQGGGANRGLSFGWQRAELVGGFFNGVFLAALGVSILLQTIERFVRPEETSDPKLIMIVGGIGLALNLISAFTVHEHDHGHDHSAASSGSKPGLDRHRDHAHAAPGRAGIGRKSMDLGMLSVFLHLLGDAFNNILVIVSGAVVLATSHPSPSSPGGRTGGFIYADPIASALVGLMILTSSLPLVKKTGRIMLEGAPIEVDIDGVRSDIMRVEGVEGVHDLHVWSLTQEKAIGTVHLVTSNDSLKSFMSLANEISKCLHLWGVHSLTIQPELVSTASTHPSLPTVPPPALTEDIIADSRERSTSEPPVNEYPPPAVPTTQAGTEYCRLRCVGDSGACDVEPCCDPL